MRTKPRQVTLAVRCLWVSLLLGVLKVGLAAPAMPGASASVLGGFIFAIVFFLLATLFQKISEGKNWARIAFLVPFFLGLIPFLLALTEEISRAPMQGALSIVQVSLQGGAIWWLFTFPGKSWFAPRDER